MLPVLYSRKMCAPFLCLLLLAGCARSQEQKQPEGTYLALGQPALMILLPGPAEAKETNVPTGTIAQVKRSDTYQYLHPSGRMIGIFQFAQYTTYIQNSPEEALMKGVQKMFEGMHTTDGKFNTEELSFQGVLGRKAYGSFTYNQKPWQFTSAVFLHADAMWQIWMAADQSGTAYTGILETAMNSIYFDHQPKK